MTFHSFEVWWWPFAFILIAGWLATDMWRWLGVFLGNKIDETAEILIYVRSVATALVAAVIAQLILFPSGALENSSTILRVFATIVGFVIYMVIGKRIWLGVGSALAVLLIGI